MVLTVCLWQADMVESYRCSCEPCVSLDFFVLIHKIMLDKDLILRSLLETIGIVAAATDVPWMSSNCKQSNHNYEWIYEEFSGPDAFIVEIYNYSTVVALSMLCLFALVFFWNFSHAAQRKDWWGMLYWLIQSTLYLLIMFLPHAFLVWQWILVCRYENLYLFLCYGGGVFYWLLHGLGWWLRPQWYYRWDERRLRPGN